MKASLRDAVSIPAFAVVFGLAWPCAGDAAGPERSWAKVIVELPTSQALFPPGNGADIANGQCLICHSAGMVLRQPPLTQAEWTSEIDKMRNAYGAPMPANQVETLAKYLQGTVGRESPSGR